MRRLDIALATSLVCIFSAMVAAALDYPPVARLVPLVVGIPAVSLAIYQLGREAMRRQTAGQEDIVAGKEQLAREATAILWFLTFVLIVLAGGFAVGGTLAVIASQRLWLRESWRAALLGGAVAFFVLYFCVQQMGLVLFSGWIAHWVQG